ncbi:MAG: hypothetical protein II119_01895 [Bacilli bacterium]|nr:hypothetical protein [Bacilli bacterium]
MNKNFYGNIDDLKKKLDGLKVSYKIKGDKIIIGDGYIKFTEKELPIRSFSVTRFADPGLELMAVDVDYDLVNKICLAYSDSEIESIVRDMPVIDWYSSNHKNTLNNVAIIWRDHFLEENVGLLNGFVNMGVKPENILAIDKGDSTKHRFEITETFKKMGFNVSVLDNTDVDNEKLMKIGEELIFDFINKRKDLKVVVLDDGAIVTKILDKIHFDNVVGVVELTEMGLRRIRPNEDKLLYPVLNVAKTKLKRHITYTEISSSIFTRIIELLAGEKLVGRSVVMCGYGDLGEILADRLRSYGVRVTVVDVDVLRLIIAAERGFTTYKNCYDAVKNEKPFMIVGASGYKSISEDVIKMLPDYGYVTSGATADLHAFRDFEARGEVFKKIDKYGTQYYVFDKHVDVLGNGRSVNLFDSEAIPNKSNDVFKAAQLLTVYNMINKETLENKLEVNIVDEWISESGILDKYYSLYMEK